MKKKKKPDRKRAEWEKCSYKNRKKKKRRGGGK